MYIHPPIQLTISLCLHCYLLLFIVHYLPFFFHSLSFDCCALQRWWKMVFYSSFFFNRPERIEQRKVRNKKNYWFNSLRTWRRIFSTANAWARDRMWERNVEWKKKKFSRHAIVHRINNFSFHKRNEKAKIQRKKIEKITICFLCISKRVETKWLLWFGSFKSMT